jgi:hypothetical protein
MNNSIPIYWGPEMLTALASSFRELYTIPPERLELLATTLDLPQVKKINLFALQLLSLILTPVPFAFYFYGARIRARSTFAHQHKPAPPSARLELLATTLDLPQVKKINLFALQLLPSRRPSHGRKGLHRV